MNDDQKRQFDSLHALCEQIWREWDHKTRHEWKLSFAIWTAILVAIGTVIKEEKITLPIVWVVLLGMILFFLQCWFLIWVQLKLRGYREKLIKYRQQMQRLSRSSVRETPFTKQPWYKPASSLSIQIGITILLICLFGLVGSDCTNLILPISFNSFSFNIFLILAYLLIICGSTGMIIFATTFPLSSRIKDLKHIKVKFLGLNGFQVWLFSWLLIIAGTIIQLIRSLV